jgi:hypothetical protein
MDEETRMDSSDEEPTVTRLRMEKEQLIVELAGYDSGISNCEKKVIGQLAKSFTVPERKLGGKLAVDIVKAMATEHQEYGEDDVMAAIASLAENGTIHAVDDDGVRFAVS